MNRVVGGQRVGGRDLQHRVEDLGADLLALAQAQEPIDRHLRGPGDGHQRFGAGQARVSAPVGCDRVERPRSAKRAKAAGLAAVRAITASSRRRNSDTVSSRSDVAEHRAAEGVGERTAIVENAPVLGFLFLHSNLHAPHHECPLVRWYALPRLYRAVRDRLVATKRELICDGDGDVARRFLFVPHEIALHPASRDGAAQDVETTRRVARRHRSPA